MDHRPTDNDDGKFVVLRPVDIEPGVIGYEHSEFAGDHCTGSKVHRFDSVKHRSRKSAHTYQRQRVRGRSERVDLADCGNPSQPRRQLSTPLVWSIDFESDGRFGKFLAGLCRNERLSVTKNTAASGSRELLTQ